VESRINVAVLGAGTMATGIAAGFAAFGFPTVIWARREDSARAAEGSAREACHTLTESGLASAVPNLSIAASLRDGVQGADFVIEAISEDPVAKRRLLVEVERYVSEECVLASTTSGLDIDELSSGAKHPERFLVTHFWNPAHLIPLVEILGGSRTEPAVIETAVSLIGQIGKRAVVLRRFVPGFLGVRLQQAVVREAIALLEEGVASAEDIDAATRLSFGARFPVIGPLETSDLGGLDVLMRIHEYLLPDLDCSLEPQRSLRALVEAGNFGVKSGRGFYDWSTRDAGEVVRRRDEELISRLHRLQAEESSTDE
jgi:3-hydroxybutyryl-CoA dehydrogenase